MQMGKSGLWQWMKKLFLPLPWCPVGGPSFGLKEARKPVAFTLFLLLCVYFILELYLFLLVDNAPPGIHLPITTNTSNSPCHVSPYCVINYKLMFLGPMDFYVHKPLSVMLNRAFHVDTIMSANFVSFAHIIIALFGVKLIANDSLLVRRLGVLVFECRNLLDSLDGVIAKEEHKLQGNIHMFEEPTNTWGYFIDGICDGIGCICLLAGCLIYMRRHTFQRKIQQIIYVPLTSVSVTNSSGPSCISSSSSHKKKAKLDDDDEDSDDQQRNGQLNSGCFFPFCYAWLRKNLSNFFAILTGVSLPAVLFLNQLLISSIFWNRNILIYGKILEPTRKHPATRTPEDETVASEIIHSPFFWLVVFSWRIVNPLNMGEVLLCAIFIDRMYEFLYVLQYSGFFIISCTAAISEIHRSSIYKFGNNDH